ncbi:MAG TPA: dihydropteroate synthase [Chthoniobacterales bacterium]|nr:dihydropteroate synthase [Chthoniobacterales bacterium]
MRVRQWKIGEAVVDLAQHGMIIGVLNVTPDSFSDGGRFFDLDAAIVHGTEMAKQGADIIDVGGESTRPGAEPVSPHEELRRVVPVIERLRRKISKLISIDTSKAEIARAALEAGACIINDVTGGRADPEMLPLVAKARAAFVLTHMQGTPRTMQMEPRYNDVVAEVGDFFLQQYGRALECGVDPMGVAFDPGIGFGKTPAHNLELLRNLERLRVHDRPIVVGVSRKSFLGKLSGATDVGDRLAPTVALTALLRAHGADVFRVHDVKENVAALRIAEALLS